MKKVILLSCAVSLSLCACGSKAVDYVPIAQDAINAQTNSRVCTQLDMGGTFNSNAPSEQVSFAQGQASPQQQVWALLAKHGAATHKTVREPGVTNEEYRPNLDLKAEDGNGFFLQSGRDLNYCYGKWTVKAATENKSVAAPANQKALTVTIELTDTPAWVKTDPQASVLDIPHQENGKSASLSVKNPSNITLFVPSN